RPRAALRAASDITFRRADWVDTLWDLPDGNCGAEPSGRASSRQGKGQARAARPLAISALNAATAAAGPSPWDQTPAETARKSAPAAAISAAVSTVIPPMATQGTTMSACQPVSRA